MNIRFAKKDDSTQIFSLLDELLATDALRKDEKYQKPEGIDLERLKIYEEELSRDDIKIFVVESENKLVALAEVLFVPILRRGNHRAVIESLVVTEKLRGHGLGSELINYVFDFCKKQGIKTLKLTTLNEFTESQKFYESHGGKFTEKAYRFNLE